MKHVLIWVIAATGLVGSACASDGVAGSTTPSPPIDSTPVAATAVASTDPAPTVPSNRTPTTVPVSIAVTAPLRADLVTFTSIANVPGALDLAYRTGDDTLFVASRDGTVSAIRSGQVDAQVVLDIGKQIVSGGEQGLLGLTFAADGTHAFVDYTDTGGNTVIAEYAVNSTGVFDAASERRLLQIRQPFSNHNGGSVRIGPDGFLYIGMGDGGAPGDPNRRALNTADLLGKVLRIDPTPSATAPYTIPADNPFVSVAGARPEIWFVGLRNPWRFNFDRSTRDLWIADVGQDTWEEIDAAWVDTVPGGSSFGWSAFEGTHPFNRDQSAPQAVPPIYEYQHGDAGCSVSGGVRYRGTAIASLVGWYVYGDYCSGQVRALQINDDRSHGAEITLTSNLAGLSAVTQGPDGELYALSVDSGKVFALRPSAG